MDQILGRNSLATRVEVILQVAVAVAGYSKGMKGLERLRPFVGTRGMEQPGGQTKESL
jgi:hypothetical protein